MHLILLSGENLKLARLEAETLLSLTQSNSQGTVGESLTHLSENLLYCTIPTDKMAIVNRLAYTKKVYEVMYVTARKNLEASLRAYPWINCYDKSFCLRITSTEHYDERYYSGFVWDSLEKSTRPNVNLENPGLFIEVFIDKDRATVTRLIYQNFETFEDRKAHLRPVLHPTAMHPKMARALINILNPKPNEKIVDPFCGACGILTEAGLLGIKFEGYDIDKKILEDATKNLEYYDINPQHYKLIVKDSTNPCTLKNVVTDLPYGKSSKKSDELLTLYAKFLKNISGRAVIVMPQFMPYKSLLDKHLPKSLGVVEIIDQYVHKSLTRKIIIIDVGRRGKILTARGPVQKIAKRKSLSKKSSKQNKTEVHKNTKHKAVKKKGFKKTALKKHKIKSAHVVHKTNIKHHKQNTKNKIVKKKDKKHKRR